MLGRPRKEEPVTYFAQTDSRGRRIPFGIKAGDRSRHMYVIGKTGMGKSTLLENMAIQDIRNGHGLCFVDPHGKTADLLLDYVPEHRVKDVLYFAPFDMDYPTSFNIMEDVGPDKRHLVVNGLMATFEKIWVDAWSARMAYILQNTLLALLEYPGSTLLGVNRMLVDKEYRRLVVNNIGDPSVRSFWVDEFAKYTDRYTQEATPAIQNKVGQFTANPLIRNIVGQPRSTFDLRRLMDEGKIIIVNLSKGKVGEGNANLLGSMFITKVHLAAMSRADVPDTELQKLPNFFLFVDEFQSFANKSFADILSEARKYKLNLTLAHQYIEQMEEEVRAAVFGNVGTMAVFRVGAYDAEFLEKEFAPAITAEDLVNLGIYQVYLKLMIDGVTSPPFSAVTLPPIEREPQSFREQVIAYSRESFARPRAIVENEIKEWHAPILPPPKEHREHERPKEPQRESLSRPGERNASAQKASESLPAQSYQREGRSELTRSRSAPRPTQSADTSVRYGREKVHPRDESAPPEPPSPLSLSHLRHGGKKVGSEETHLSELRQALSEVLKHPFAQSKKGTAQRVEEKERMRTKSEDASTAPPLSREQHVEAKHAGEIPEELLRKLLEVPNPPIPEKEPSRKPPSIV
ncbi:MAG: hypothetical protein A3G61_03340 [Candidatus Taylorbacteria bacterium RIFCSPLOWO2_12_FULL_49_67]|nr:MAG: hypothetical protein A3G61_03340 [Candidatus Taylorbacteria bacterium RIFCSPLOWO2_12_FULL_49_67]